MPACTYCGCDVDAHDPVCVRECGPDGDDLGRFCNFGCLAAHIDAADLAVGTTCAWTPD